MRRCCFTALASIGYETRAQGHPEEPACEGVTSTPSPYPSSQDRYGVPHTPSVASARPDVDAVGIYPWIFIKSTDCKRIARHAERFADCFDRADSPYTSNVNKSGSYSTS